MHILVSGKGYNEDNYARLTHYSLLPLMQNRVSIQESTLAFLDYWTQTRQERFQKKNSLHL